MNIQDIIASRQYSFVYEADAATVSKSTNKGGRSGVAPNPLYGRVSKRAVYAGQAATAQMLEDAQRKLDPTYQPDPNYTPRFEAVPGFPCVVRSLATGELQVRIMRPRCIRLDWQVDGRPATEAELATIRDYTRKHAQNPLRVRVMFPSVERLANVDGELPEVNED